MKTSSWRPLIIQYFHSRQLAGPYFIRAAHGQKQEFRGALLIEIYLNVLWVLLLLTVLPMISAPTTVGGD
jgi:hypothetical protein